MKVKEAIKCLKNFSQDSELMLVDRNFNFGRIISIADGKNIDKNKIILGSKTYIKGDFLCKE